jgi:HAD superfamily hydrolase (TIGR01484 family)
VAEKRKISLVLADVDGTLVTEEKVLTKRAQNAVGALRSAGIRFAITSGRPPRGMAMLFDVLDIDTPIAGFNGGLFVERDLTILEQKEVPADVARQAIELMREHGLDTWVYSGNDWLITKIDAPHVAREAWTVKFEPKVVANLAEHLQQVAKIVGVSDDLDRVQLRSRLPGGFRTACDRKPVTALLSRCHQQRRKQGRRCRISLATPRSTGARDRYHWRSTK